MEKSVTRTLQKAVKAAVGASSASDLPIKYINRTLEGVEDGKYLEIVKITNNPQNESWGDEKTHRGILRLILHWPIDNKGAYPPMDTLQSIMGYFTKGRKLKETDETISVTVTGVPNMLDPIESPEGGELLVVASIRYNFFNA